MSEPIIVSATDFKAHCLEYITNAQNTGAEYIITKRKEKVAKLGSYKKKEKKSFIFGRLKNTMTINGDIMSPIDVEWEANL